MKRFLKFLVLFVCLFLSGVLVAGEVKHQSFHSKTLNRDYVYNIYLPDGYQSSGLRYPVFYMALRKFQLEFVKLRIFDGDHNFDA